MIGLLVCWLEGAVKLQPASTGNHMDKVAAIPEKLTTGTYNVASSQVADKIIECLLTAKLQIANDRAAQ